jgi:hypothetical protein
MGNSRVNLRDPWVAAFLSWLVPGLGHFYQGRLFKAGLYSVCILGTFFFGRYLGDGKVVNWQWGKHRKTYGYFAQVLAGGPALPALIQSYRQPQPRFSDDPYFNRSRNRLERPLEGPFEGLLLYGRTDRILQVEGRIQLEPQIAEEYYTPIKGHFSGVIKGQEPEGGDPSLKDGAKVELDLTSLESLEPAIYPSPNRELACRAQGKIGDPPTEWGGTLSGSALGVRSLWNRYDAPLDDVGLQEANGDLGKYYELGLVFTWIAGLLNILVMWDAFEGPAYGYGDEEGDGEQAAKETPALPGPPASGTAPALATAAPAPPASATSPASAAGPKPGPAT